MDAPFPVPPKIESVTAPILFGYLFDYGLFGILSVQVFLYAISFPSDPIRNKLLVYGVYLIEAIQVIVSTVDVYYWLASGYGNFPRLNNIYIAGVDAPILCGLVSFIVQSWFCYRIRLLKRELWWWGGMIFLISAAQAAAAIAGGVKAQILGRFSDSHNYIELIYIWFVGSATVDILIAGTMTHLLLQARAQGLRQLDHVLIKLVTLIIETNVFTASVAILCLIIFLAAPKTNWFICPVLIIGKLYSNTLMVSFNNRSFLRTPTDVSFLDTDTTAPVSRRTESEGKTAVNRNRHLSSRMFSSGSGSGSGSTLTGRFEDTDIVMRNIEELSTE